MNTKPYIIAVSTLAATSAAFAQFSKSEALRIAADILDSGKTLKTIFVSYGDPDFYFGLDVFKQYFPNVQIIATPETVKHIQDTQALKVAY